MIPVSQDVEKWCSKYYIPCTNHYFNFQTVKKFKCCLITRGTYVGVAKIVGKICSIETLKWNYGCMSKSIGVLHWQNLYGKDYLLSNEVNHKYIYIYIYHEKAATFLDILKSFFRPTHCHGLVMFHQSLKIKSIKPLHLASML